MVQIDIEPGSQVLEYDRAGALKPLRILMVAPQPFFSARGTPFSVLHRIRALVTNGHQVDLITYPFGEDVPMDGLRIIRSRSLPLIKTVKIGPSVPKIFLDVSLYFETVRALAKNDYDVVHSHEEAAFFCAGLAKKHRLIHIYDMHSSLPQQLSNLRSYDIGLFRSSFERLESHVLRTCDGVITICEDLAAIVRRKCPDTPHSMIENMGEDAEVFEPVEEDLVADLDLSRKKVMLYTGTLEEYQGIDLLLSAMPRILESHADAVLVLVGGAPTQVKKYQAMAEQLGIGESVRLTGTVHPSRIPNFLGIADVIVSPRSRGTNTPLKIYKYMRTNVPLVATDRHTHTQILNNDTAVLVPADAQGLTDGVCRVLSDTEYGKRVAAEAKRYADQNYSDRKYVEMVNALYALVLDHKADRAENATR